MMILIMRDNAVSDLGLHCLSMSHKRDIRHMWVKQFWCIHFATYFFARVCSNVCGFNKRNRFLTSKLLKQVIDSKNFVTLFLNFISYSRS